MGLIHVSLFGCSYPSLKSSQHSIGALDIIGDVDGLCCGDDRYCYFNNLWQTRCCSLGVTCEDSPCSPNEIYCNITSASGAVDESCCDRPGTSPSSTASNPETTSIVTTSTTMSAPESGNITNSSASPDTLALGLGLGLGLPFSIGLLSMMIYLRIRAIRQRKAKLATQKSLQEQFEKPELCGVSSSARAELPDTGFRELDAYDKPQELSVAPGGMPHELPGSEPLSNHGSSSAAWLRAAA